VVLQWCDNDKCAYNGINLVLVLHVQVPRCLVTTVTWCYSRVIMMLQWGCALVL
jgi:hypothetical protein